MKTTIKTTIKTALKTHIVILVKIKKSLIKKMSFIKIKDPRKREELIKDLIETRKRIKDNFIARKVGESEYQSGLTKLFKPVTETQKATAKEITEAQKATAEKITSELLPIKEGVEGLPVKLFNQVFPSLVFKESDIMKLGPLAVNALIEAFTREGVDRTYGIHVKDKRFYIGNKPITIKDNDIIVDDFEFKGTPGLWELITSKNPIDYTEEDKEKYRQLVLQTNFAYRNNNPNQNNPKSNGGKKWKKFISPIWDKIKKQIEEEAKAEAEEETEEEIEDEYEGEGLTILPNDPNALIDRFDLLFASQNAGHTGVRNEMVSILDVLKSQGDINKDTYKKLNSIIKK